MEALRLEKCSQCNLKIQLKESVCLEPSGSDEYYIVFNCKSERMNKRERYVPKYYLAILLACENILSAVINIFCKTV